MFHDSDLYDTCLVQLEVVAVVFPLGRKLTHKVWVRLFHLSDRLNERMDWAAQVVGVLVGEF
jgi:hypothetical protein